MEITVLKTMHQKRIQFRTFLICEILLPGGDVRLGWRAGNMVWEDAGVTPFLHPTVVPNWPTAYLAPLGTGPRGCDVDTNMEKDEE